MQEFQVRRKNFVESRLFDTSPSGSAEVVGDDEISVKVVRFAYSSNNVTYAAAGDKLGYWQFFPPTGNDDGGWGMTPVWGFGEVVESNVETVPVGERLFGYFPPASALSMRPVSVSGRSLVDGAPHRAKLPPGYNLYRRVRSEPGYDETMDNERMLLWPLYITSFCIWDSLQENAWYEAQQLVIVSASSKTSIGLAYALAVDSSAPPVLAITSIRHLHFVTGLGLYGQALHYDALTDIDAGVPTTIIDMSGNTQVLGRLHTHLGVNMKRCINVGLTHWDEAGKSDGIIRERSEFFFAPAHIQKRLQDWGPDGFTSKSSAFMHAAIENSRRWLKLTTLDGLPGLQKIYRDVCEGRLAPEQGLIIKL